MIIHFPEPVVGNELVSLAINLAANKRNADMISEDELQKIIDRAKANNDVLLWKFVKNIAINGSVKDIQDCLAVNNFFSFFPHQKSRFFRFIYLI